MDGVSSETEAESTDTGERVGASSAEAIEVMKRIRTKHGFCSRQEKLLLDRADDTESNSLGRSGSSAKRWCLQGHDHVLKPKGTRIAEDAESVSNKNTIGSKDDVNFSSECKTLVTEGTGKARDSEREGAERDLKDGAENADEVGGRLDDVTRRARDTRREFRNAVRVLQTCSVIEDGLYFDCSGVGVSGRVETDSRDDGGSNNQYKRKVKTTSRNGAKFQNGGGVVVKNKTRNFASSCSRTDETAKMKSVPMSESGLPKRKSKARKGKSASASETDLRKARKEEKIFVNDAGVHDCNAIRVLHTRRIIEDTYYYVYSQDKDAFTFATGFQAPSDAAEETPFRNDANFPTEAATGKANTGLTAGADFGVSGVAFQKRNVSRNDNHLQDSSFFETRNLKTSRHAGNFQGPLPFSSEKAENVSRRDSDFLDVNSANVLRSRCSVIEGGFYYHACKMEAKTRNIHDGGDGFCEEYVDSKISHGVSSAIHKLDGDVSVPEKKEQINFHEGMKKEHKARRHIRFDTDSPEVVLEARHSSLEFGGGIQKIRQCSGHPSSTFSQPVLKPQIFETTPPRAPISRYSVDVTTSATEAPNSRFDSSVPHRFHKRPRPPPPIALKRTGGVIEMRKSHEAIEFQVLDGGYGWVCVGCVFVMFFLVTGIYTASGVVYLNVKESFPETKHADLASVFAVSYALTFGLAPIANRLGRKFTVRWVAIFSSVAFSLCLMAVFYTPTVPYMFACYGFAGIFGAGTAAPGILVMSLYFSRHRSLATGIALSGAALSGVVQPPIVERLCHEYDFHGAMLIVGALTLNALPCAMLLRYPWDPLVSRKRKRKGRSSGDAASDELPPVIPIIVETTVSDISEEYEDATSVITFRSLPSQAISSTSSPYVPCPEGYKKVTIEFQVRLHDYILHFLTNRRPSALLATEPEDTARRRVFHPYLSSRTDISFNSQESDWLRPRSKKRTKNKKLRSLCNPVFFVICVASVCTAGSYPHMVVFLPSYGHQFKLGEKWALAILVSFCFLGDIIGRVIFACAFDKNFRLLQYGLLFAILVVFSILCLLPVYHVYWYVLGCMFFYGLAGGPAVLLMPAILAAEKNCPNLSISYGVIRFGQAAICAIVPPLGGLLMDITGHYKYGFLLFSSLAFLSAFMLIFITPAKKCANRQADECVVAISNASVQQGRLGENNASDFNSPGFSMSRRNIASRTISHDPLTVAAISRRISDRRRTDLL